MAKSRVGADYKVGKCVYKKPLTWQYGWERRTSGGYWVPISEPSRYVETSHDQTMQLYIDHHGELCFMRAPSPLPHLPGYTILWFGPKHELWDLFIAHGRMIVSGGT